jgi:PLD-like domain
MNLCIQDPAWNQSDYLLEKIIEASSGASRGGGAFAFASLGGINLLLGDAEFRSFLARSSFELVVGVDAVTTVEALKSLAERQNEHANLHVKIFMSPLGSGLFHPKFCWFRSKKSSALIGSGNLTASGLRGNREAFTVVPLDKGSQTGFEDKWRSWLDFNSVNLFLATAECVVNRAKQNKRADLTIYEGENLIIEDANGKISVAVPKQGKISVLVAEIPKSGNRWNQANFDLDTFQSFFGAAIGHTQRIILTHVASNGEVGHEEVRPSVAVSSQNYRFELEAGAGLDYPKIGRPIGVFVRVGTRTFRYRLLMPRDTAHSEAVEYLDQNCSNRANRMGRHVATVDEIKSTPLKKCLKGLIGDKEFSS